MRRLSGQARGHTYHFGIHRKMHQRTTLEGEDRLARVAVLLVLAHRILYPLAGQRVLQFQRHDGDAVQAQRDVQRLLGARREVELAGQTQTVGGVAGFKLGIQLVRRLEVGGAQGSPVTLEAVPQRGERAVGVHPLAQVRENLLAGPVAVQRLELRPRLRLRFTDEGEHRSGKNGALAVEAVSGYRDVSVLQQVGFDDGFEGSFGGGIHWLDTETAIRSARNLDSAPDRRSTGWNVILGTAE